jgi:hypothetical protein
VERNARIALLDKDSSMSAKDGSVACFGKIGECSGLKPSEKSLATPKLVRLTPPKSATPVVIDGVIEEPMRAPPRKQLWCPKPNHLRNPLDTPPEFSGVPPPKASQSPKKPKSHRQTPPKGEVRFHYEREGHLVAFCFRRW